jgi:hypothetical protein
MVEDDDGAFLIVDEDALGHLERQHRAVGPGRVQDRRHAVHEARGHQLVRRDVDRQGQLVRLLALPALAV